MSEEIARYGNQPDPDQEAAEALKRILNTLFIVGPGDGAAAVNVDLMGYPQVTPQNERLVRVINKRLIKDMKVLRAWWRIYD